MRAQLSRNSDILSVPPKLLAPTTTFSRRLQAQRLVLKISQMELGVRAGIDELSASGRVNQYERGKHAPDNLTANRLAEVLNVPVAYLYCVEDDLADLLVGLHRAPSAKRRQVISEFMAQLRAGR